MGKYSLVDVDCPLSVVQNSEVIHYSGAVNVLHLQDYVAVGTSTVVHYAASRCLLLVASVNEGSAIYPLAAYYSFKFFCVFI